MYKRQVDIKNKLVFINEFISVETDCSMFAENVVFYLETEEDWWVEKKPFSGREKDVEVRNIALDLIEKASKKFYNDDLLREQALEK
jgi:hypothetical protein